MAAPITHIVLSEKFINKFFQNMDRKPFFIGTLFPDIRYLNVIDRAKTHYSDLYLSDLGNYEPFLTGLKFHSILDLSREKFIVKSEIYSLCPDSKYITQSLKFLEDKTFYSEIKDWQIYSKYLDDVLQNERDYGVLDQDIWKWHSILKQYFAKQPNEESIKDFILNIGFTEEVANEINHNINVMEKNDKIIEIVNNLYANFEPLIS